MEIKIEAERYNPLLRRREVHFRVKFENKTPTRGEVREKLAGLMNAELDRIVVQYIKTEFGKREAKCYAKIYESAEDLKKIEDEYVLVRNFPELKKKEEKAQAS